MAWRPPGKDQTLGCPGGGSTDGREMAVQRTSDIQCRRRLKMTLGPMPTSQKALGLWDMGWAVTEANASVRQRVPVERQIRAFKLALRRRSGCLMCLENPVQFEMLRDGKLPHTACSGRRQKAHLRKHVPRRNDPGKGHSPGPPRHPADRELGLFTD